MPTPTLITTESVVGPYVAVPVSAADLNITWTAADVANGNQLIYDAPAGDILLAWNKDYTASHNFTLTSSQDTPFLRTGDISGYALAAGQIMAFYLGNFPNNQPLGWSTFIGSNYFINFSADSASVYFAILQIQGS
jgi:hypothetical protein